jgi:hypothetical protein
VVSSLLLLQRRGGDSWIAGNKFNWRGGNWPEWIESTDSSTSNTLIRLDGETARGEREKDKGMSSITCLNRAMSAVRCSWTNQHFLLIWANFSTINCALHVVLQPTPGHRSCVEAVRYTRDETWVRSKVAPSLLDNKRNLQNCWLLHYVVNVCPLPCNDHLIRINRC